MKSTAAKAKQMLFQLFASLAVSTMIIPGLAAQSPVTRVAAAISGAEQTPLKDSQHPLAQAQYDAGRVPADTRLKAMTMVFNRSADQEASLKALIAAQQSPASPLYHKWLTPDQFAVRFGMSDADLEKIQGWLQQQGFAIDSIARSKNAIHFTGSVKQVESAFSTEMHYYKVNGTQHFAPSTALSVPASLAPVVLSVRNLDDFRPRPHMILGKNRRAKASFTGAGSTSASNQLLLFAPGDIATAYDINPLYKASIDGTGQSITIVGQSAIAVADLEAFQTVDGLAIKDPNQFVVPGSGTPTVSSGDESESDLDLEWSNAIAPGATINFVYTGDDTNYSAFDSIQYAIDESIGTIVSSSYGICEAALGGATLESSFEQGTAQGQTFVAAAGDDGSTDCNGVTGLTTTQQESLAVDYPASSQYVTGMGGTEISQDQSSYNTVGEGYWESNSGTTDILNSVQQYIPETVWNDDSATFGLSSSGGGASSLFTKPTWQTGVAGIPTDSKRDVPDIALYASPNFPGYLFCSSDTAAWNTTQSPVQQGSCTSGFEDSVSGDLTVAGGTSFDAPIFSGILALINQKQGYSTGQGLINPTLYTLASDGATYASAFHDITSGNNNCSAGSMFCGSINNNGFSAGTGYDEVTGLGSIDVANLAGAWPVSTTTSTLIPTTTIISASSNGPAVGATDTFTITVTSASGTPTGSILLTVDTGTPVTETLSANGTFVYTTSFADAGAHTIFASYVADTTYAASQGSVTVTAAAISSGTGKIALSTTPATLTVAQGSSGSETINVTPSGGYTGTIDLTFDTSDDTALQNLCYDFTSQNSSGFGTVAITGTTAGSTQLTLDANAQDCASTTGDVRGGHTKLPLRKLHPRGGMAKNGAPSPLPGRLPMSIAFAGVLLVGFMGRSSRKLRGLAAILLLAAVGLAVSACGSSSDNVTVRNPAKGNYTVTVTGQDSASTAITATTTFTFTIN
jgi:subtilase family serine protease